MKRGEHCSPSRDAWTQGRSAFWTCSPRTRTRPRCWRIGLLVAQVDTRIYGGLFFWVSDWQAGLWCGGRRSEQQLSVLGGRDGLPRVAGYVGNGRYRNKLGHGLRRCQSVYSFLTLEDCGLWDRPLHAGVTASRPIERRDKRNYQIITFSCITKISKHSISRIPKAEKTSFWCGESMGFHRAPAPDPAEQLILKCLLYFTFQA